MKIIYLFACLFIPFLFMCHALPMPFLLNENSLPSLPQPRVSGGFGCSLLVLFFSVHITFHFSFSFFFFPLNKIVNYWKRGSPCEIGSQGLGNVSNHRFLSDLSKTASYANSSHSKTAILWLSLHCFSHAHQEVRLVLRPNDRAETETQLLHSHVFPLNWSIRA